MDGFTKIPNEMLDALAMCRLTNYQWRVLCVTFRRVNGWNKSDDWISLSQFSSATGVERGNVHRAIRNLEDMRIVVVNRDYKKRPKYRINKDVSEWVVLSLQTARKPKKQCEVSGNNKMESVETTAVVSPETTKVLYSETGTCQ